MTTIAPAATNEVVVSSSNLHLPPSSSSPATADDIDNLLVLPAAVSQEESDSDDNESSMVESSNDAVGKKRERKEDAAATFKQLKPAATTTDDDSSPAVASASKANLTSASRRRRSPRKRKGETQDDLVARLGVDGAAVSTPETTPPARPPLFSTLLSPHQQACIFSPAPRTPHSKKKKQKRESVVGDATTTPTSASPSKQQRPPNSILRQSKHKATKATSSEEAASQTTDTVATNLAQTMEDVNSNNREASDTDTAKPPPTTLLPTVVSSNLPTTTCTPTTIEVADLHYRMSILFPPEKYPGLEHKPCILPRLVACYTLHKDYQEDDALPNTDTITESSKRQTRRRKRSMDGKTVAIQRIQPIMEFLIALMDLEWNLLEEPLDGDKEDTNKQKRRVVHFAAFDGSSLCPPSDVTENSHQQQATCIQNLTRVLDLVEGGMNNGAVVSIILQDLVHYLDHDFRLYYHDQACAQSIDEFYPTRRVEKAAAAYSRDLESVLELWRNDNDSVVAIDTEPIFLSWQCRLADVASQLVRFWLRTLMNPIPCRAEMENKTQRWQDRFVDIVDLVENSSSAFLLPDGTDAKLKEEEESAAIADGSLSAILSNALSHIYDYLGGIPLANETTDKSEMWTKRLLEVLPGEACCTSDRCQFGIGTGRKPAVPLSDEEWKNVGDELQVASDFFAFYHRVLFLEQLVKILLSASGDWASHWESSVQSAAQHLVALHKSVQQSRAKKQQDDDPSLLPVIQQEDAHLILLGLPLEELLQRLQQDVLPLCEERYGILRSSYQTTVAAFKLGKANTQHKKRYQPQVGELEEYWRDLFAGTVFPSVTIASSEEDEDSNQ